MAVVTGKTSEKLDELFAGTIAAVALDSSGQLVYTKKDGSVVNAGSVANSVVSAVVNGLGRLILTTRQGTTIDAGVVGSKPIDAWPVGSIYMSVSSTDPATTLGGGVWQAWGSGKVPVGIDTAQAEFNAVEQVGGEKTHTLTIAEMPVHKHTATATSDTHAHGSRSSDTDGGSTLAFRRSNNAGVVTGGGMIDDDTHTHTITIANSGGDTPHNILQPYITCYMWKRTG